MEFFVGASYLFLINSVFIALASFIMIRYLRFPLKKYLDPKRNKKVKRILMVFGILVMIPSAYTFYNSIMLFRFESEAKQFINSEIKTHQKSKIIKAETFYGDSVNTIELYMIGEGIDSLTLTDWNKKMKSYKLKNTVLYVYQDQDISNSPNMMDLEQNVRNGLVEDIYKKSHELLASKDQKIRFLERTVADYRTRELLVYDISNEAQAIVPQIENVAIGENFSINDSGYVDTIYSMMVIWNPDKKIKKKQKDEARIKLQEWLMVRLKKDSVIILDVN
jgi:hypothetical protein